MSRDLFQNTEDAEWRALSVELVRQGGSLGFNITGGVTVSTELQGGETRGKETFSVPCPPIHNPVTKDVL